MFPDIAYLDWMTDRLGRAEYDLGSSDLRRVPADADAVVPPALADLAAPEETTVEEQLADVYGVEPENVLVTAGATHANLLAAATALGTVGEGGDTGDWIESDAEAGSDAGVGSADQHRVLVEKPGYEPLLATPTGLGATVDRFRRPDEEGYPLDPDRVAAAAVEDTALVTVTNRHNPSGRRADRDVLAETARVAGEAGARLLVDEVYAPFDAEATDGPFGDEAADAPFGGPTAAGLPNAVVTGSLTKFFGFGGLRIGWLVADAEFVSRARSVNYHLVPVADPSRRLARRVLAHADRLAEESRERIRTNREALAAFVAGREDLSGRIEPGCPYAFLEHESADGTEVADAAWEAGVLVVPGRFFDDAGRFRVGACRGPSVVRAGLDRFGDALDMLAE